MRLQEILDEVQKLNNGEFLSEAKKKAQKSQKEKIKAKYDNKKDQALKIANKLKAKKGKINWTDDMKPIRNEVVSAFMNNAPEKVIDMMTAVDGYKTVEILKALETAHGGYAKLEAKAGDKKNFVKTVFGYIDEIEGAEATEETK